MFTGIITAVGTIDSVEARGDLRARIASSYDSSGIDLGASIACSGVCLTVIDRAPGRFVVDISAETLSHTARGQWEPGRRLNLERAMRLGDELGGHIVTGHVDGVGTVSGLRDEGDSKRLTVDAPASLAPYLAVKGSVTLDGVSLTVNDVADGAQGVRFGVNIIPHTAAVTTLGDLVVGQPINIEIDVLARYLGRMEQVRGLTRSQA